MEPGRELDILVAEKIFGAKVKKLDQKGGWRIDYVADLNECNDPIVAMDMIDGYRLKRYSSDVLATQEVIKKLVASGYCVDLSFSTKDRKWLKPPYEGAPSKEWRLEKDDDNNQCTIYKYDIGFETWIVWRQSFGKSMAHTICLAALETLEKKDG